MKASLICLFCKDMKYKLKSLNESMPRPAQAASVHAQMSVETFIWVVKWMSWRFCAEIRDLKVLPYFVESHIWKMVTYLFIKMSINCHYCLAHLQLTWNIQIYWSVLRARDNYISFLYEMNIYNLIQWKFGDRDTVGIVK